MAPATSPTGAAPRWRRTRSAPALADAAASASLEPNRWMTVGALTPAAVAMSSTRTWGYGASRKKRCAASRIRRSVSALELALTLTRYSCFYETPFHEIVFHQARKVKLPCRCLEKRDCTIWSQSARNPGLAEDGARNPILHAQTACLICHDETSR